LSTISQVHLLKDNFFLTGGTALSEFYLQHRYSEDLDFFTSQDKIIEKAVAEFSESLKFQNINYKIVRNFETFAEVLVYFQSETVKIDFAFDSPYRLENIIFNEEFKIYIDNIKDISCNKLSALFDRAEPKDFVDIYFINKEIISINDLIPLAKNKHVGLDEYWLARVMFKIQDINFLPKMIKVVSIDELKTYFLNLARELIIKK
jgi:predicted nucleotidyltransferase component of viral defense system